MKHDSYSQLTLTSSSKLSKAKLTFFKSSSGQIQRRKWKRILKRESKKKKSEKKLGKNELGRKSRKEDEAMYI
tara:strand:- start:128 stop:346 length:219 start_codon:yes stop_codon:yes gene_type:complete